MSIDKTRRFDLASSPTLLLLLIDSSCLWLFDHFLRAKLMQDLRREKMIKKHAIAPKMIARAVNKIYHENYKKQ